MQERKTYFVDVILPVPIHNSFTYRVPLELNDYVKNGVRVVVPFGKSKLQTGIIIKVHEEVPTKYQSKYVESVLDDEPIITGKQLKLWYWISEYYMAPIGDVMNAALPSNFKLGSETKIQLHPESEVNSEHLTDREYQVFEALEIQGELDLKEISDILQIKTIQPVIKSMIDKRVVITKEELKFKYAPKTQIFIELTKEFQSDQALEVLLNEFSDKKRKEKQVDAVLKFLKLDGFKKGVSKPILRTELEQEGASVSSLNTLEKEGVFESKRLEISRIQEGNEADSKFKELSESQGRVLDEVRNSFIEKEVTLLHGVTGSGKTEIYVELIQEQLNLGKQVLFLLPEIALTTQLIDRLSRYFGEKIGVYHSRFNQNERIEIWNALLKGDTSKFQIVIGARSSVFLPFRNLGLIIVDEEHESSFKQYDPSPRYNARDTAIVLRSFFDAKVLLGSATPAIESYYNALEGKYSLVELHERFGNVRMPEIFTANIKKEKQQKTMQSDFSGFLVEHMKEALENKEQIILFQNRRGYNPVWACEVCGWNPQCKNCDVSLTYHKNTNILKCHYCSYFTPPVGSCPKCGSNRLKMIGFGTEKIEDELSIILPGVRVQRLDLDTTRQKNSYESILSDFDNRKIDILVGTQMVTKGLDFDNVSLVGILDADMMLRRPDFRSFERSYQLMSQVAGRAGRKLKRGKVIIQTYDPDHWIIRHVIDHDYIGMYKNEIIERKNYFYPPYYKMINLTLKHRNANELEVIADDLAKRLKAFFGDRVLGPEFPVVKRIQNSYLKVVRLKIEREASPKKAKAKLNEIIEKFYTQPTNKSARLIIDVDPL
ncbi:MAG: primosomal protein N' [Fluviicola sp.]|nr:MAG: primosomal protein N' [Fluviicola sp.]